jgi:DNA replication protein DnaC
LLVIDDLGTESMNNLKFSELFTLLNTRLLNQNNKITKTIISTNLSLDDLASKYGDRIISRFIGNYNVCYFFGDDIRLKR